MENDALKAADLSNSNKEPVKELKEIREAFNWTWENMGTPHTSDHFNIPANGVESIDRLIRALSAHTGDEGVEKVAEDQKTIDAAMALVRAGYDHAAGEIFEYCVNNKVTQEFTDFIMGMLDEKNKKQFVFELFEKELKVPSQSQYPDFFPVLEENYQAQIAGYYNHDKTDAEREKRNAVIVEYQDLIAIYKSKSAQWQSSQPKEDAGIEEDQEELWDNAMNIICQDLNEELPSITSTIEVKKKFHITKK